MENFNATENLLSMTRWYQLHYSINIWVMFHAQKTGNMVKLIAASLRTFHFYTQEIKIGLCHTMLNIKRLVKNTIVFIRSLLKWQEGLQRVQIKIKFGVHLSTIDRVKALKKHPSWLNGRKLGTLNVIKDY